MSPARARRPGAIHPARDERLACAPNIPQNPVKAGVDVDGVQQTLGGNGRFALASCG
jgi:hypothetical protein